MPIVQQGRGRTIVIGAVVSAGTDGHCRRRSLEPRDQGLGTAGKIHGNAKTTISLCVCGYQYYLVVALQQTVVA